MSTALETYTVTLTALLHSISTSPSIYLQFLGTIGVYDGCGQIGQVSTSPFIAVAPEHLSTVSLANFTMGQEYRASVYDNGGGISIPLNVADLECPTFGLGKSTAKDGNVHFTVGPPWLPMIVRPEEILAHDPEWSMSCQYIPSGWWDVGAAALFDPPRVLVPVENLGPNPTRLVVADPTSVHPASTDSVAQPAQLITADQPAQTGGSDGPANGGSLQAGQSRGPSIDPATVLNSQSKSASLFPADPATIVTVSNDPPAQPAESATIDQPAQPGRTDESSEGDPAQPIDQNHDPSVGEAIMLGFGTGPFAVSASHSENPSDQASGQTESVSDTTTDVAFGPNGAQALTVGGKTFIPNLSGFQVAETSVRPNGPAVTISGTPVSLGPLGIVVVGDKSFTAANSIPVLPISDQIFTANADGFPIGVSNLAPAGPAITIADAPISLGSSGVLVMGSQTLSIPLSAGAFYPVLTVGEETITVSPTGFSIAGTRISVGGPAVTVSGVGIILGDSGELFVGSQTLSPNSSSPTAAADEDPIIFAGQTITPQASGFIFHASTVLPGGSAIVANGATMNLATNGVLEVSGSVTTLAPNTDAAPIVVAGQTITAQASGFVLQGATVLPGRSAIVVNGTSIILASNGVLHVGTSLTTLAHHTGSGSIIVAGETVVPQPTGFVLHGSTVLPGGSAVTVNGTRLSLAPDGVLDVGESVTALASQTSNLNSSGSSVIAGGEASGSGLTNAQDFAGKARMIRGEWELAVGAIGFWTVWMHFQD